MCSYLQSHPSESGSGYRDEVWWNGSSLKILENSTYVWDSGGVLDFKTSTWVIWMIKVRQATSACLHLGDGGHHFNQWWPWRGREATTLSLKCWEMTNRFNEYISVYKAPVSRNDSSDCALTSFIALSRLQKVIQCKRFSTFWRQSACRGEKVNRNQLSS